MTQQKPPETAQNISPPTAVASPARQTGIDRFSAMWWLTLCCLVLAIGLVWWSLPEKGISVFVQFPEGHGLQSGDQVLFRGIEIGVVKGLVLTPDASAVEVEIELRSDSANLAREGTRFWIVRPQLSLIRISGLETAVGHKYVSLSPGPEEAARAIRFEGLVEPPIIDSDDSGIEIVLRGDRRYGVQAGATVNFRGVPAGRVLSVNISQDSRYVDARIKIFDRFTKNLTTASRFWAESGVDFDFSLANGLRFDSDSLLSIIEGSVSFLTISNDGTAISPGHIYRLYQKPDDEWLIAANGVTATDIELKGVLQVLKRWKRKGLFGQKSREQLFNGIPSLHPNGNAQVFTPIDALNFDDKAIKDTREIVIRGSNSHSIPYPTFSPDQPETHTDLAILPWTDFADTPILAIDDFRQPNRIEDCLAVRAGYEDGVTSYLHYNLDAAYIREDWSLPQFDGDSDIWSGAAILAASDGKVIGMLVFGSGQARILPYRQSWFDFGQKSE